MVKEIKEFIWSFCTDETYNTFENATYEISGIEDVISLAEKKFNIKIEFKKLGNYGDCRHDKRCYSWASIMPNGELYFDSCCTESY